MSMHFVPCGILSMVAILIRNSIKISTIAFDENLQERNTSAEKIFPLFSKLVYTIFLFSWKLISMTWLRLMQKLSFFNK